MLKVQTQLVHSDNIRNPDRNFHLAHRRIGCYIQELIFGEYATLKFFFF